MKIAYISTAPLSDVDISYLIEAQKYFEIYYYIRISQTMMKGAAINIKKIYPKNGVFSSDIYEELDSCRKILYNVKIFIVNNNSKASDTIASLKTNYYLCRHIAKRNVDVIHITWPCHMSEMLLYYFRNKIVLTMHDPFSHSSNDCTYVRIHRKIAFKILNNFIVLNKSQKQDFINTYKLEAKNVYESRLSCYNYLKMYTSTQDTSKNYNYILFFGLVSKYKGLDYLFPAIKQIQDKYHNISFISAGNGQYWFDISTYESDNFKIINRYIPEDELAELICNCKFVVCPYVDATQSGVIMSAFAFNKPVIATSVGGLPEMVNDGKYGLIVEPRSVESLVFAMEKLITNEFLSSEMSRNIEHDYQEEFLSWPSIVKEMQDIYNNIIKRKSL